MRKVLVSALAGLLGWTVAAQAAPITVQNFGGAVGGAASCPQTVKFTFLVHGDQGLNVTYRFVRSDGGSTGPYPMTIGVNPPGGGAGISPTQYSWTLGDRRALPSFKGWVKLEVLTPKKVTSDPYDFAIKCT